MSKGNKGGAARGLSNDDYTFLYGLGLDDGDIEMIEFYNPYVTINDLMGEYVRIANQYYNIDITNIEDIASNNNDQLPNSTVNKRDIAREVVHFFSNEGRINGGYRKRSRKIKTRRSKKSRSQRMRSRKNRKRTKY